MRFILFSGMECNECAGSDFARPPREDAHCPRQSAHKAAWLCAMFQHWIDSTPVIPSQRPGSRKPVHSPEADLRDLDGLLRLERRCGSAHHPTAQSVVRLARRLRMNFLRNTK